MRGVNEFIQNLRSVYQKVPEGVLITDLKGTIVFVNNQLLGYSSSKEKDWLNKPVTSHISGFNPTSQLAKIKKTKTAFVKTKLVKSTKKSEALNSLVVLLESDEKAEGFVYIIRLTKNYSASNAYSLENNPITKVLSSKDNEVWLISDFQNAKILFCSPAIEKISGWTNEEFIFGAWTLSFILTHPMDRLKLLELMEKEFLLRHEQRIVYDHIPITATFRMRKRDNTWIWIYDRISVLERDENGTIKLMIGSLSEFKQNESEEKIKPMNLLERDIIIKDGKTYVNIDAILSIQKNKSDSIKSLKEVTVNNYHLSNRELEILSHIVEGLSSKEISEKIHITMNTVNMHRKQIMKKMNARNLAEMVKKCFENGLFSRKI
ncbi:MAG: PAS domain-containing protein [Bacteroidetes bacterium]|nr:MAG: PAS domain-containing protein [Bacteroidota bacterium]